MMSKKNLLWIRLKKERFLVGAFENLKQWADGPYRIVKWINCNAYKINLSNNYNISTIFNVAYLSSYYKELQTIG